jgi:hypothetical protein
MLTLVDLEKSEMHQEDQNRRARASQAEARDGAEDTPGRGHAVRGHGSQAASGDVDVWNSGSGDCFGKCGTTTDQPVPAPEAYRLLDHARQTHQRDLRAVVARHPHLRHHRGGVSADT